MSFYLTKPLNIPLGRDVNDVEEKLLKLLGLRKSQLKGYALHRQSVDARSKSDVHFVCSYVVETSHVPRNAVSYEKPLDVLAERHDAVNGKSCIVVGAGPAGLFAALYLAKSGVRVTVVEQGADVDKRRKQVKEFFAGGAFDSRSNVQFGLGGAGTFSDGKLTTGISSPLIYTVFEQFVRSGAPRDILTSALPHVGTDKLVSVVANLRDEIICNGGEFLFEKAVKDFAVNGRVCGVCLDSGEVLKADAVLLACGHSARDIFYRLAELGATVEFKPFAVGLRVEHSREFINNAQYGTLFATHRDLPSASYKLVMNGEKRSCYSFCMCPGGIVVAANSEPNTVVVNGMSDYARDAANSNSALVVNITAQDVAEFGHDGVFAGVEFQCELERRAYVLGGGDYRAPCQNVTDFVNNKVSSCADVAPSYPRGTTFADLRQLFPQTICQTLCDALLYFDKKIDGFGTSGVLTGVESRTSSSVRIVRGEDFQSNLLGLYPVGEGAGYAGGIVSSAVDGLRVARRIVESFK